MPYVGGEHPEVGDKVCDKHRRGGIVTHVIMWGSIRSELVIEWEDGTVGIRYTNPENVELLGRRGDKELVITTR